MSDRTPAGELAAQAAEAVRRLIAEAEARAAEIIREAETEAASVRQRAESDARGIRERAESDARAQIEAARRALDELGGSLAAAVAETTPEPIAPSAEAPPAEPDSEPEAEPEPEPEPEPAAPAESPSAPEAPISPPAPEPERAAPPTGNGDDAAVRLVAMKLALDGKDRAEIEAELAARFGGGDRTALLDDVLARAGR